MSLSREQELVRSEFAKSASALHQAGLRRSESWVADWVRAHVPLRPEYCVLDVAGGGGGVASFVAAHVRCVVVVDLTPEMLVAGRARAEADSIRNVVFQVGDAAALAYVDDSFDLVLSTFSVHHFAQPAEAVAEMVRVCRPGGHVALVDIVIPDADLAARFNHFERLRNPSHREARGEDELTRLLVDAGGRLAQRRMHDQAVNADAWLRRACTEPVARSEICRALRAELVGGPATGLRPTAEGDRLKVTHTWLLLVAHKPR